uniref:Sodium channel protein Nach-like n=1 Tax=Parastrongyloides trichosuri TaxID=131310 RepID=A0A0N4ZDS0_PARTI
MYDKALSHVYSCESLKNDSYNDDNHICKCSSKLDNCPAWICEIHGIEKIILSSNTRTTCLWSIIIFISFIGCILMTTSVTLEFMRGDTSTSTSIIVAPSLKLPALTICPKSGDILNFRGIFKELKVFHPNISIEVSKDLIQYFLGGNGFQNMDRIKNFERTYVDYLELLYNIWSYTYSTEDFFFYIYKKYGYKCNDLFVECYFNGYIVDCCQKLFRKISVLRRGICYQTIENLTQTELDDAGKLKIKMRAPLSTTKNNSLTKTQLIVYVNDNFDIVTTERKFYIYPNLYNNLILRVRHINLVNKYSACSNEIEGDDGGCIVRRWLKSNIIGVHNCTFAYLRHITINESYSICNLSKIVRFYYGNIDNLKKTHKSNIKCVPGCKRWQYFVTHQKSDAITHFVGYNFYLDMSFLTMQYEEIKESYTTSIPAFMAQIGGQFGFFLGISIITMLQIIIYLHEKLLTLIFGGKIARQFNAFFTKFLEL